jgi:hypothetical protein
MQQRNITASIILAGLLFFTTILMGQMTFEKSL